MDYCKAQVDSTPWHTSQCHNRASTAAGYCRIHDPEMAELRRAARPLTKFQRQKQAYDSLNKWLDENCKDPMLTHLKQLLFEIYCP